MDFVVNDKTTLADLLQAIYRDDYYNFNMAYAELIGEYPEFEDIIREAWTKSSLLDMSYSQFRLFFQEEEQQTTIFDGDFDY